MYKEVVSLQWVLGHWYSPKITLPLPYPIIKMMIVIRNHCLNIYCACFYFFSFLWKYGRTFVISITITIFYILFVTYCCFFFNGFDIILGIKTRVLTKWVEVLGPHVFSVLLKNLHLYDQTGPTDLGCSGIWVTR